MKKILFITTKITDSGGVSSILSKKINALCENTDINIAVASTNDVSNTLFFNINPKVPIFFLKTKMKNIFSLFEFKRDLKAIVKQYRPDIITVVDNGLKSLFIKKMFPKIPIIYEIHSNSQTFYTGDNKGIKSKIHQLLSKNLLTSFDKIITQSPDFLLPNAVKNVLFIPNFVEIQNNVNPTYNINRFIAVGRIIRGKNYEALLRIWHKVLQKHPDKQLHIYGYWEDSEIVSTILNAKNKNVFLHKPTTNKEWIYNNTYTLLHPSQNESFPMVFLEAMSYGVPIICFDINQPNLVINNITGNVVENGNEQLFFEKIIALIENKNQRNKYSENSLKHIHQFSEKKIIEKWIKLYELFF